jgi:hypothetical protein
MAWSFFLTAIVNQAKVYVKAGSGLKVGYTFDSTDVLIRECILESYRVLYWNVLAW